MKITKLRSNSLGIEGTVKNMNHHAKKLINLVNYLANSIPSGFTEWRQGNGVHVLITKDNRIFVIRPIKEKSEAYVGIQVQAKVGIATMPLITVYHDKRNGIEWKEVINFLTNTINV